MADTSIFEHACAALEQASGLDRLAARGTIRLALRHAGLETTTLTSAQLDVVVQRLLPQELHARGIANPAAVCADIASRLVAAGAASAPTVSAPEDLFRRLRGG